MITSKNSRHKALCSSAKQVRLIACSHRTTADRHGQDKTVLSCLVSVGGVNTTADSTRQFCLVLTQIRWVLCHLDPVFHMQLFSLKYIEVYWKCGHWKLGERQEKTIALSAVVFTLPTRTRQDSLVLSVSAVWTKIQSNLEQLSFSSTIALRRASWPLLMTLTYDLTIASPAAGYKEYLH